MFMHDKETYKSARKKKAVVYWIHYPDHTDPTQDGYIGISTQVGIRFRNHMRNNAHMRNRVNKGAVLTILHDVETLEEAAQVEKTYRPHENIGWNTNAGGDIPPKRTSAPEKNKLSGDERTDKQKEASRKHSERMKSQTPWNKGTKGKQIAWNKGKPNKDLFEISQIIRICPHCDKQGKGSSMLRWHFNNCKFKTGM